MDQLDSALDNAGKRGVASCAVGSEGTMLGTPSTFALCWEILRCQAAGPTKALSSAVLLIVRPAWWILQTPVSWRSGVRSSSHESAALQEPQATLCQLYTYLASALNAFE